MLYEWSGGSKGGEEKGKKESQKKNNNSLCTTVVLTNYSSFSNVRARFSTFLAMAMSFSEMPSQSSVCRVRLTMS